MKTFELRKMIEGCSLRAVVRRLRVRVDRRRKGKLQNWLPRWNRACARMWEKLSAKPATRENFEWFDRNHGRLMELSRAKSGKSPNDESSDLRTVGVPKAEQREPQVRCDDWLGEPNKSGAPVAESGGVGGGAEHFNQQHQPK